MREAVREVMTVFEVNAPDIEIPTTDSYFCIFDRNEMPIFLPAPMQYSNSYIGIRISSQLLIKYIIDQRAELLKNSRRTIRALRHRTSK